MKVKSTEEAMEEARVEVEESSLALQGRFPWSQFASASFFVLGSVLYLVLAIEDYKWAQELQELPMWLRTADDDASWVSYRLEERYNASLVEELGDGGRRLTLLRRLQFEAYQSTADGSDGPVSLQDVVGKPTEEESTEAPTSSPGISLQDVVGGTYQQTTTIAPSSGPLSGTTQDAGGAASILDFLGNPPEQMYYDQWWLDLPPGIREAYTILGYNETIWNTQGHGPVDKVYWDDLAPEHREAAIFIGYTKDIWNENVTLHLSTMNFTQSPTSVPSHAPSSIPSQSPTAIPSQPPTAMPSFAPSAAPSTMVPSRSPTAVPSFSPSAASVQPTTLVPAPSQSPTTSPSFVPSTAPSLSPSATPIQPTPAPAETPPAQADVATTSAPISTPVPTSMPTTAATTGPPTVPTPAELYYDSYWAELPTEIQDAYAVLGYTPEIWDEGETAEADGLYWDQMSPEQQEAASFIGYTQEVWDIDEEGTAAPTLEQTEEAEPPSDPIEQPDSTSAVADININNDGDSNNNNNEQESEPETIEAGYYDDFDWGELPPHVQEAAASLGYNENIWDSDGVAAVDDYWWDELTPEQQAAASILGYDKYSWNGFDPEMGETVAADGYVSYDDDYVFRVKSSGTWVSRYMILYFSAALCFVSMGTLDLIREKHKFHILMIIAGLAGVVSAMLVEKNIQASNILNAVSVHFFMLEAFTLFSKRAPLASDSESSYITSFLAFAELLFATGALIDVILSYVYLLDDTSDWNTTLASVIITAAVLWLLCSLIYMGVFFYEYCRQDEDLDLTYEKELHCSEDEVDVVVPGTAERSNNMDRTEESTRDSPDDSSYDMPLNVAATDFGGNNTAHQDASV